MRNNNEALCALLVETKMARNKRNGQVAVVLHKLFPTRIFIVTIFLDLEMIWNLALAVSDIETSPNLAKSDFNKTAGSLFQIPVTVLRFRPTGCSFLRIGSAA